MAGQFSVVNGPEQGKTFNLDEGQTLVIGRGQASDAQINDPHMSRVHCRVASLDGRVTLSDAGSTGGTFVGNEKVESVELTPGTVFRAGSSEIRFQLASSAQDTTVKVGAVGAAPRVTLAPLNKLVGQSIKQYHIDSIIAEGSNSTVFKATDTEKDQVVAFKVLTPDPYQSDEQKERFVRAMKAMMPTKAVM